MENKDKNNGSGPSKKIDNGESSSAVDKRVKDNVDFKNQGNDEEDRFDMDSMKGKVDRADSRDK